MAVSGSSRFSSCSFFCIIFQNIFWKNTCGWQLPICEFLEVFQNTSLVEHLWENAYFMYKLQNFNHQILSKSTSQVFFKRFIQEREVAIQRRSFTYNLGKLSAKKLTCNGVTRYQPGSLQKKTLSHILLHVFCIHFLRIHQNYFFQRNFESVRAQFLSGNISGK